MPHTFPHGTIGTPFIELQSVDSTNNYARQLLQGNGLTNRAGGRTGEPVFTGHGTAVFAHEQTHGKGQRGKAWLSDTGSNIALSIILNTSGLLLSRQFQLSACVATATYDLFSRYAGDETSIKWPNDLYWRDRKAGGILIETIVTSGQDGIPDSARWAWAIAGIGININQTVFDPALPNPVSLKQITGKDFDPVDLAKELCDALQQKFTLLLTEGFEKIYQQYLLHLYCRDQMVKLKKDNRVFEATIKTVLPNGKLVIAHAVEEEVDFGEVEWLIK